MDPAAPQGPMQETTCSFCGARKDEVFKLIAGRGARICDVCVARCRTLGEGDLPSGGGASSEWALLAGGRLVEKEESGPRPRKRSYTQDQTLVDVSDLPMAEILAEPPPPTAAATAAAAVDECAFCERGRAEIRYLVARGAARICDECLGLCEDIIAAARAELREQGPEGTDPAGVP
jgi:hypothetical protein